MTYALDAVNDTPRPFSELRELPAELRVRSWLAVAIGAATLGGIVQGALMAASSPAERIARCVFLFGAYGDLTVSMVDFAEHYRLEKAVTGRYLTFVVVPLGESLNHVATVGVIVAMLVLGRPLPATPEWRDLLWIGAPALYLVLGWRDELVYHRRRASHREDLMHTVAHIAAAVMLAGFVATRLLSR